MKSKDLTVCALFSALLCVVSPITVLAGGVPISFCVFVIAFLCRILKTRLAVICVIIYILLGILGFPVFAGFKGGIQTLLGLTGGYILAYPIFTIILSFGIRKFKKYKILICFFAVFILNIIGITHYMILGNLILSKSIIALFVGFLCIDFIKVMLAMIIGNKINKLLKNV